jgi:DNA modification methylase
MAFYAKKRAREAELGRELTAEEFANDHWDGAVSEGGTSIFDPVLCELAYRWFCPPGGRVLDPFAGGSVRGIVAGYLGLCYRGIELRPEQVEANREQADLILPAQGTDAGWARWEQGDSAAILAQQPDDLADLVFSCPPYFDLERYGDDPEDLSNAGSYDEFITAYREIIRLSVQALAPDRFACFVVGDIRVPKGIYRGFVPDTIGAFEDAGASFYNEAILVTSIGSLAVRAARVFSSRKLAKAHQNVLVFVKGDPAKAVEACGPVEVPDLAEMFGDPS